MSSEIKLIVQNNLEVDDQGRFGLNFAQQGYNGKHELFLSENDEFLNKNFMVNIDTSDTNHTDYKKENNERDFTAKLKLNT